MTRNPAAGTPRTLAERLDAARGQRFVGRDRELALFREALSAPVPPFAILHLHGPGGVGKSALLDAFERAAAELGAAVVRLDGRELDPSPAAFLDALERAGGSRAGTGRRLVLLVDTFERLAPLDGWLRASFLPELPGGTIAVLAGRDLPRPEWTADTGWGPLTRLLSLRNLRPDESLALLRRRGLPEQAAEPLAAFTHGHPLALSLIADLFDQGGDASRIDPATSPDLIGALVSRFAEGTPSELHRRALDLCAHARVTTEALIAAAVDEPAAPELFAWLRSLSFIEQGPDGLVPHELTRDALDRDLRWRNPEAYRALHDRVRSSVLGRLRAASGRDRQRAFFDLLFLHRNNAVMRPYVEWSQLGSAYAERATEHDHSGILALVERHEGTASARIAQHWLRRQPGGFTVFREADRAMLGFMATIDLTHVAAEDRAMDPAVRAAEAFIDAHGPARPDDLVLHHRFAMGREVYQGPSAANDLVMTVGTTTWLTTPRLAWSLVTYASAEPWRDLMRYISFRHAELASFGVGGHAYAVYAHDWRAEPPAAWLEAMSARELAEGLTAADLEAAPEPALLVLSRPAFDEAVKQALRAVTRPSTLASNPLLRARLVRGAAGDDPAGTLLALLRSACEELRRNPKDERLYRALHHTYLAPAPTQEQAAELLGLPFSTYRYHLTTGIERVADALWQRELARPDCA